MVEHDGDRGGPALDLRDPVGQRRERADDHKGPVDALGAQVREEADGLHGLSQAHLVCQDAVETVLVERDEPLDA